MADFLGEGVLNEWKVCNDGGMAQQVQPGGRGEETGLGKTEKYRRRHFHHFALKMEAVMISEASAVHTTSSWCHRPETRSTSYQIY